MSENILSRLANSLPIRWGYFKKDGQPQKVIFVGHEKAIYGADGVQLDNKLTNMKDSLSDAFSEDKAYTVGQYCIYLNRLYKFIEAKSSSPWDGSKVVPVSVTEELGALNVDFSTLGCTLSNVDLNDVRYLCFGYCNGCKNRPEGVSNGFLESYPDKIGGLVLQKYTPYNNHTTYTRQRIDGGSWTIWK